MPDNHTLQIYKSPTGVAHYIRPTPLISINRESLRNKMGDFGGKYTITFTGTLIEHLGGISTSNNGGGVSTPDINTAAQKIMTKQKELRELFAHPVLRFEIGSLDNSVTPDTAFYAKLQSLNFEEGIYTDICRYTAIFEADFMTYDGDTIHDGDIIARLIETSDDNKSFSQFNSSLSSNEIREQFGGIISDMSESWSIEVDESLGMTSNIDYDKLYPRSYKITRDIVVTGKDYYVQSNNSFLKYEAWSEAKAFADKMLITDNVFEYPGAAKHNLYAKYIIDLSQKFHGYNHLRTESINKTEGSVSISDTWVMCSGTAFENYTATISSSNDSPYVNVNINGTIKGLSAISPSGEYYGGTGNNQSSKPYENALKKYHAISNSGLFGINSFLYKRANSIVEPGLNPQPLSISLNENKFNGEISYNLQFDNRPQNIITNAISEIITVNDTYPGDLYALIPVIGRKTGPVLQYIGGRTEYRRDVSIDLVFDYLDIDYSNNTGSELRKKLILSKPTLHQSTKQEIQSLITQLSPMSEPNLRKCFLNPPTESWNPKDAKYSLNLSWVYELSDGSSTSITTTPQPIPGQTP